MILLEDERKKFRFRMPLEMRWSDMDELGHVNNAVYLTYFEQARIHYFQESCEWNWKETGVILANAHIDFLRPVVYPNRTFIYLRTGKIGTKSFELNYLMTTEMKGREKLATTGSTTLVMFDYARQESMAMPDFLREKIVAYEPEKL
ncbi:MAG: acyl-CoA thioesterase [Bacteroidetes bacterium]|nr:acyl-CoA thioesterase [Bacteroidota bacterium]